MTVLCEAPLSADEPPVRWRRMRSALRRGNPSEIQALLTTKGRKSLNWVFPDTLMPFLSEAVSLAPLSVVSWLVEEGAHPGFPGYGGAAPPPFYLGLPACLAAVQGRRLRHVWDWLARFSDLRDPELLLRLMDAVDLDAAARRLAAYLPQAWSEWPTPAGGRESVSAERAWEQSLRSACRLGRRTRVRLLLACAPHTGIAQRLWRHRALVWATENHQACLAASLVEAGAEPNEHERDILGQPLLPPLTGHGVGVGPVCWDMRDRSPYEIAIDTDQVALVVKWAPAATRELWSRDVYRAAAVRARHVFDRLWQHAPCSAVERVSWLRAKRDRRWTLATALVARCMTARDYRALPSWLRRLRRLNVVLPQDLAVTLRAMARFPKATWCQDTARQVRILNEVGVDWDHCNRVGKTPDEGFRFGNPGVDQVVAAVRARRQERHLTDALQEKAGRPHLRL